MTGGTRGIGFQVSRLLIESGQIARLVVVGRTAESVSRAVETLGNEYNDCALSQKVKIPELVGLDADLSRMEDIQHLASVRLV